MQRSLQYALSISLALSLFTGCAIPKPKAEKQITTDTTLPIPSLNGSLSDINTIAFEWKAISDPNVSGYNIYRSTPGENNQTLTRVGVINSRFATHYVDEKLTPNTLYRYRFTSTGKDYTESTGSEMMEASTLPMIAPVSFFQSVGNMPRSAKLLWRPHPNTRISGYVIERLNVNEQEWKQIKEIEGRLTAEYIDRDLKDGQVYHYRVRAVTFDKLSTQPSETAKVVTKPLPKEVQGITATTHLPKAIALKWEPSALEDLSHYNIYRAASSNGNYTYRVKLIETSFTDTTKEDGELFYYKITAVDKDGLESPMGSPITQGMSLAKPRAPIAYDGKINPAGVDLQWSSNDSRIVSYTIIKTTKTSWIGRESIEINDIKGSTFHDANIKPNIGYIYQVMGVDKDGVRSLPTTGIELFLENK
ncbi:MAG TPA: fibronectin type III domain-containing protein [Sulfuricurvum sp.]|nr:fibronectin type III domain-containing protein [Sulfuricurvum sp.]